MTIPPVGRVVFSARIGSMNVLRMNLPAILTASKPVIAPVIRRMAAITEMHSRVSDYVERSRDAHIALELDEAHSPIPQLVAVPLVTVMTKPEYDALVSYQSSWLALRNAFEKLTDDERAMITKIHAEQLADYGHRPAKEFLASMGRSRS